MTGGSDRTWFYPTQLQEIESNSVIFIFSQPLQIFSSFWDVSLIVHPKYLVQNKYQKQNKLAFNTYRIISHTNFCLDFFILKLDILL